MIKIQRKKCLFKEDGYIAILRVTHKKHGTGGKKSLPCYNVRCGCCDQKVQIFYDNETLEINGVNGTIENWREILLPLLGTTKTSLVEENLKKLREKYPK
jgi:hypothetical protein